MNAIENDSIESYFDLEDAEYHELWFIHIILSDYGSTMIDTYCPD